MTVLLLVGVLLLLLTFVLFAVVSSKYYIFLVKKFTAQKLLFNGMFATSMAILVGFLVINLVVVYLIQNLWDPAEYQLHLWIGHLCNLIAYVLVNFLMTAVKVKTSFGKICLISFLKSFGDAILFFIVVLLVVLYNVLLVSAVSP